MARDRWATVQVDNEEDVELGSVNTLTTSNLDRFLQEAESITTAITTIAQNARDIRSVHQRTLLETSTSQQSGLVQQVDGLTGTTTDLIQETRTRIKQLSAIPASSQADAQIQARQQKALANKLMTIARDFQNVQQEAKTAYKGQMARQYKIAKPNATQDQIDDALNGDGGPIFQQELLSSRIGAQRQALEAVQNRHEELAKIERSITELFTLFQDMQALLDAQQEQIVTIEQHVETTHTNVEGGGRELTKAVRSAKSARKLKRILACVLLIILIAVVLGLLAHFGVFDKKNNDSQPAPAATPTALSL
ncbi:t-SNARE [Fimicolochytrium jonesii]|uniref:t-SNARE n=1 Tax=Fimicolochytrium jonesii TaxID=1396493 RepID=UPI0022FDCD41|nr:t-SNARE [Fimicolochytrium jonesii]KAI8822496.1 t-SNARE [Fimicolochytrium jonesii]